MATLTIELPVDQDYHTTNLRRWEELLEDETLSTFPGKVETNRHGHILMMPPPGGNHSRLQGEFTFQIRSRLGGHSLPECPVSTINGVKAIDVGWFTSERFAAVRDQKIFNQAPEICVEILSPSNTIGEMQEKKMLYFEAGAKEVWICDENGLIEFYLRDTPEEKVSNSALCPDFPSPVA